MKQEVSFLIDFWFIYGVKKLKLQKIVNVCQNQFFGLENMSDLFFIVLSFTSVYFGAFVTRSYENELLGWRSLSVCPLITFRETKRFSLNTLRGDFTKHFSIHFNIGFYGKTGY